MEPVPAAGAVHCIVILSNSNLGDCCTCVIPSWNCKYDKMNITKVNPYSSHIIYMTLVHLVKIHEHSIDTVVTGQELRREFGSLVANTPTRVVSSATRRD